MVKKISVRIQAAVPSPVTMLVKFAKVGFVGIDMLQVKISDSAARVQCVSDISIIRCIYLL